ncbi:MAG: ABC transporter permease [Rhodobacteraceae bacterium]|nr:MAG: ABC transporter permease [Paracoccaceae bacterium]
MSRIRAVAYAEGLVLRRNRWLYVATLIMVVFAVALSLAGSAPTGTLGVDMLTVSVASMTTLAVYLIPLLALLMSFDAVAGEADRGALGLILSYPASRAEILLGKGLAHVVALAIACVVGFGVAGGIAVALGGAGPDSLMALGNLMATSILLGAVFVALGYLMSALAGSSAAAAGLSAALWLVFVVLYDLGLLATVVMSGDGAFTRWVFPWVMVANPADAFRLWNIAGNEDLAIAAGMVGAGDSLPAWAAPASLLIWPVLGFWLARAAFQRREP